MRDPALQTILELSRGIIAGCGQRPAMAAGERVFGRLDLRQGEAGGVAAEQLPACRPHVADALGALAEEAAPLPQLAEAFAALAPRLAWYRRRNAEAVGPPFFDGHANAMLVGPNGLEAREDVWVGATVMAPHITYPDHDHPPEEVYIALSPGAWWNAAMDWTEPGPGGIIYNPPGILHAMRSGAAPFLALWFLPVA